MCKWPIVDNTLVYLSCATYAILAKCIFEYAIPPKFPPPSACSCTLHSWANVFAFHTDTGFTWCESAARPGLEWPRTPLSVTSKSRSLALMTVASRSSPTGSLCGMGPSSRLTRPLCPRSGMSSLASSRSGHWHRSLGAQRACHTFTPLPWSVQGGRSAVFLQETENFVRAHAPSFRMLGPDIWEILSQDARGPAQNVLFRHALVKLTYIRDTRGWRQYAGMAPDRARAVWPAEGPPDRGSHGLCGCCAGCHGAELEGARRAQARDYAGDGPWLCHDAPQDCWQCCHPVSTRMAVSSHMRIVSWRLASKWDKVAALWFSGLKLGAAGVLRPQSLCACWPTPKLVLPQPCCGLLCAARTCTAGLACSLRLHP